MADVMSSDLANLDGVSVHIERLPPGHREAGKVYVSFNDATGATVRECILDERQYGAILQQTAESILKPS